MCKFYVHTTICCHRNFETRAETIILLAVEQAAEVAKMLRMRPRPPANSCSNSQMITHSSPLQIDNMKPSFKVC